MYTAFLGLATAFALVSANGLFLILPPGMLLAVLVTRTPREEAMLEERFGEEWRAYRARTGALLPRLW
jgi:protein-S-isoprenylcysteine O-methyltransferase Ste14